jgi:BASS family bile acid:Na+ symporter
VADLLTTLITVFVLIFVVGSMLAMGFSLSPKIIVDPLRDYKFTIMALVANFIVVPVVIIGLTSIIPSLTTSKSACTFLLLLLEHLSSPS